MGHSSADDIVDAFEKGLQSISIRKILQLSMDGPNVNSKFLEIINKKLQTTYSKILLNLGSCGLHASHSSIMTGHDAADWSVQQVVKGMYDLFKQSPARRADYLELKPNGKFLQDWCENGDVCNRATEIYEDIKSYMTTNAKKLRTFYTVKVLKTAFENKMLTLPKIMFFSSISSVVEPCLEVPIFETNGTFPL